MIHLAKVRAVATFELLSTVKRKGYLIATFGMPVFLTLYGLLLSLPGYLASRPDAEAEPRVYAVVDEADVLQLRSEVERSAFGLPAEAREAIERAAEGNPALRTLQEGDAAFRPFPDLETARTALERGEVRGIYHLPADYLASGRLDSYRRDGGLVASGLATDQFRDLLEERLLAGRLPAEIATRVGQPVAERRSFIVTEDGRVESFDVFAVVARFAVPGVFAFLLFLSLMMSSGYLLQATATEKENKVVEVLLSSADPDEILFGKLLGLGAAALLQVAVWTSMLAAAAVVGTAVMAAAGISMRWQLVGVGGVFFVATYLFVGSLILATASLGGNLKESQQWSAVWTLLMVSPFFFTALLIDEPGGTVARTLTWIPFTSALTLLLRLTLDPETVPWWEIGGAFAVLVLATWLSLRFGGRLFRVGLLLTGSRPRLREILRQARLGDG